MSKNIISSNYERAFPLTKDKTILINYLRYGNVSERIEAICQIDDKKENYDLIFEIFLSDIHYRVKHNALSKCMNIRKDKVYSILDYLITTNKRVRITTGKDFFLNNRYIVQIAEFLNKENKLKTKRDDK